MVSQRTEQVADGLDAAKNRLDMAVPDGELTRRRAR